MSILRLGVSLYVNKLNSLPPPSSCWLISRHSRQLQANTTVLFSVREISHKPKYSRYKAVEEKIKNKKKVNSKHSKVSLLTVPEASEPDITYTSSVQTPPASLKELQLDCPPVLFIQKYQQFIDTKDIVVKDELSDMEKDGRITPGSLTSEKIEIINKAVKNTETFKQLVEALRKQPEPLLAPPRATTTQKSVFVDSDFEVIRAEKTEGSRLSLTKYETELEWSSSRLEVSQLMSHYLMLSKSRLTLLVCLTASAGYGMAPGDLSLTTALLATIGTGLASSAANSINQILEVPFDSQMNRTKNRVLVRGQVSTLHAATFAGVLAAGSTTLLYTLVNPLTAALSLGNLVLYTSVYTPMKRYSILNTWVGSLVGAVPPLIGWTAATGALEPGAFVLAGILYTWQFPHFNSLSWNLRPDYSRAGGTTVTLSTMVTSVKCLQVTG